MRYVYLRLFLSEIEQPPILLKTGTIQQRLPRQEYLEDVFNRRWHFSHYSKDMVYVPIERGEGDDQTFTFGRVGRKVSSSENASPDEKFETTKHVAWMAANLLLNTSSSPDGQKLAIQDRIEVGKPISIINSLVNHINETLEDSGWIISANPIVERQSFWEAVEKHKGQITRAEFTYVTPNVLGIRSKLNERLKEYRANENAQEVTVILSEPKGQLQLNSQEVHDAVDYTSEGGGSAKLKVGRETIFDSQETDKAVDVETDDITSFETTTGRQALIDKFFR